MIYLPPVWSPTADCKRASVNYSPESFICQIRQSCENMNKWVTCRIIMLIKKKYIYTYEQKMERSEARTSKNSLSMPKEFLFFKLQLSLPHSAYLGRAKEALVIYLLIYIYIFKSSLSIFKTKLEIFSVVSSNSLAQVLEDYILTLILGYS